ncbi:hypothetical protein TNCV_2468421 [Trichonephila clavipes]|nr:hypothetical protein TNCV_2468421 [Trichonephila clavipes]
MAGKGRPNSSMTEINTARIEEIIKNDQMLSLSEISSDLRLSYGSVHDFCDVWFLPESVARVAAIVGDYRCHTPRH